ncbi:nucleotidyltransferase family protein [Thiohalorhabdus sp. Cl-TMA]|uniref:NTP transferase domain-containing protein n=1 Tax=Thiohalorhabdus methylotrophus TaxID=3242694 RepID=A0ABV4TRP5_9GAMM
MNDFSAVLLAAGASRRMQGRDKLTLPLGGEPLVRRTARTLLTAGVDELVAVVAADREDVRELLMSWGGKPGDGRLRVVSNPEPEEGQMRSVTVGLAALEHPAEGILVALADQPLLTAADIRALMAAFRNRERGEVVVPTFDGQRGNPIVLAAAYREAVLAGGPNLGCRHFMERHPELVEAVPMASDHFVEDLDTPEDLERISLRLEGVSEQP